ncbi:putative membrane protein [Candidatus Fervidibacter sacchari]|uniref:Membrane protein n=1 Tax=Candidatus Fervidibacter sacchari TaxID=1448929 RepID=A0ABT2EIG4_9BACT|nr:DUF2079 domain-containing protein [Candidatus Fervidibacter sacchari]MCS3917712.1 putative membrane protein [Candidatus Fervidibacter sacchari]
MTSLRNHWSLLFVLLTCLMFVLYFLWLQIRRYEQLGAYAFDLGIFQQAVWLMAHGEAPFVTVRGMNILSDHFTPILYLVAIPYRFWAHPFWLFLAQTVALAAGALPLYRLALRHIQKDWLAAIIAIGYLLHPALFTMLLFDFHPVLLSIPFVLWAMDAADEGRPKVFAIAAIFALACKEEVSLVFLMLSAYAAIVRKQKWAWWGIVGSVCWIAIVLKLMPFLAGVEHSAYLALYSRWGETPLGIVWGILTRPFEALRELVLCQGHATAPGVYPLLLLFPFAFFPLLAPDLLLFGLPNYALIALNERVTFRELGYQYASTILPWLAVASMIGWKRLLQVGSELPTSLQRRWHFLLTLTWCICVAFSAYRYGPPVIQRFMSDMLPPKEAKAIVDFLNRHIPPDASVTAPTSLVPPLAHRKRIYMFPNPFQQVAFGPSVEALKQQIEMRVEPLPVSEFHKRMREQPVDFVVLKARPGSYWPLGFDAYETLVLHALTCPDYGIIAVQGDVVILKHKADFSQGLQLLGVSTKRQEQLRDEVKAAWERLKSVRW